MSDTNISTVLRGASRGADRLKLGQSVGGANVTMCGTETIGGPAVAVDLSAWMGGDCDVPASEKES